jgi:hypothetical protein
MKQPSERVKLAALSAVKRSRKEMEIVHMFENRCGEPIRKIQNRFILSLRTTEYPKTVTELLRLEEKKDFCKASVTS